MRHVSFDQGFLRWSLLRLKLVEPLRITSWQTNTQGRSAYTSKHHRRISTYSVAPAALHALAAESPAELSSRP